MKIAVIGGGVSGLVCAAALHPRHEVTVFESASEVGGHSATVDVEHEGRRFAVDTGFIVFNRRNYPEFCARVIDRLGVPHKPAPMTFGVRCERSGVEWGGAGLSSVFAQRRNLLRPAFLRMLADIRRFGREAAADAERAGAGETLGGYLRRRRYSRGFAEHYLKPMAGAIWSAPTRSMDEFPLRFLVRFFGNHGMLTPTRAPQWLTVDGGSREYVRRLTAPLDGRIRVRTPVQALSRDDTGVTVRTASGDARFDHAVCACHADTALRLLTDATPLERSVLGAFAFRASETALHTDVSALPRSRRAWSAWNALLPAEDAGVAGPLVTYNLSILQSLPTRTPLLVSLNQRERIDPSRVLARFVYDHPVYTHEALAAQERWGEISGVARVHYCGAYWGNGFHEDGVVSGVRAARAVGAASDAPTVRSGHARLTGAHA